MKYSNFYSCSLIYRNCLFVTHELFSVRFSVSHITHTQKTQTHATNKQASKQTNISSYRQVMLLDVAKWMVFIATNCIRSMQHIHIHTHVHMNTDTYTCVKLGHGHTDARTHGHTDIRTSREQSTIACTNTEIQATTHAHASYLLFPITFFLFSWHFLDRSSFQTSVVRVAHCLNAIKLQSFPSVLCSFVRSVWLTLRVWLIS